MYYLQKSKIRQFHQITMTLLTELMNINEDIYDFYLENNALQLMYR
jgi:hypothetical protein